MTKPILMHSRYSRSFKAIVIAIPLLLSISYIIQYPLFVTLGSRQLQGGQPDINAAALFDTHSMRLGNNIKNLLILIPNEAHESTNQPKDQLPLANQPYLPQNAVVNSGTTVVWFNADVDHDHKITISGSGPTDAGFESGDFAFNTASPTITFNNTGTYNFLEANVNDNDPSFVMNGTIDVINQANPLTGTNVTSVSNLDTVGTFMVPANNLDQYVSTLTSKGFTVDSTHSFQDLRGGQKGTGPEQAYVVWTTSGMNLDQVISSLKEITPSLPYS